jgi:hypothetical protein
MKNAKPIVMTLKFRKISLARYVIKKGNTRNIYRMLAKESFGKCCVEDQIIYGNVTLRWNYVGFEVLTPVVMKNLLVYNAL